MESNEYLTKQILTYLGNKRSLLDLISDGIEYAKSELKKPKVSFLDLFSGSGIVSRYAKSHSSFIIANDLELYSKIINDCYLANPSDDINDLINEVYHGLCAVVKSNLKSGFITELYAPNNDENIVVGERVFYTRENAMIIDTIRSEISKLDVKIHSFFLAPLIYAASVHTNTSGVFKGFYKNKNGIGEFGGSGKNALSRIKSKIVLQKPIFSRYNVPFEVYQKDANELVKMIDGIDVCYLDPPYNQHPYGSNYFMLNLIAKYERPEHISEVSGIPKDWNRSRYNKNKEASEAFFDIIDNLQAKIFLISYNNEGIISHDCFLSNLSKFGNLKVLDRTYNTFRASRNLKNRSKYVKEFLYILKKT